MNCPSAIQPTSHTLLSFSYIATYPAFVLLRHFRHCSSLKLDLFWRCFPLRPWFVWWFVVGKVWLSLRCMCSSMAALILSTSTHSTKPSPNQHTMIEFTQYKRCGRWSRPVVNFKYPHTMNSTSIHKTNKVWAKFEKHFVWVTIQIKFHQKLKKIWYNTNKKSIHSLWKILDLLNFRKKKFLIYLLGLNWSFYFNRNNDCNIKYQ